MKKTSAASRYAAYDSPSPSPRRAAPSAPAATPGGAHGSSSRALVTAGRSGRDLLGGRPQPQHQGNLGSVLRRLISMDKKPPSAKSHLPVPPAAVAAAKNTGGGKLPGLSRKLFQKGSSADTAAAAKKTKALTDVKNGGNNANTRTLAMVLRSERELLAQSKAQEDEIAALRLQLENKDREVERLKDLCLRQREEIRTLKDAVLFPDAEPEPQSDRRLRDEISTLTGQIQCLAQELAQACPLSRSGRMFLAFLPQWLISNAPPPGCFTLSRLRPRSTRQGRALTMMDTALPQGRRGLTRRPLSLWWVRLLHYNVVLMMTPWHDWHADILFARLQLLSCIPCRISTSNMPDLPVNLTKAGICVAAEIIFLLYYCLLLFCLFLYVL